MKILIFHTYNKGFLAKFFFEISRMLINDGYKVYNFSFKQNKSRYDKDGVKMITEVRENLFNDYKSIFSIIKEIKPDVIISNFSYVNPALLFGKLFGISRNIAWFHSLNAQTEATRKNVMIKILFLKLADKVIANSQLTRQELIKAYKLPKQKVTAIPFYTNIKSDDKIPVDNSSEVFKIGCPGRFVKHKNQELLIRLMRKYHGEDEKEVQLFLAGSGPDKEYIKKLILESKLQSRVHFLDHVSSNSMPDFYRAMDLIILPSLDEAFGLVFIEAISLGIPVLVSNNFGALTFIDKQKFDISKIIFNPENIEELKQKTDLHLDGKGENSSFFNSIYQETFVKEKIYNQIKMAILSKN